MSKDDPQRTQEWDADTSGAPAEAGSFAAGSTAEEATQVASGREAQSQADRTQAEARGAELRAELRETDARRAEEETAKAQEATAAAEKEEEKREVKQRKAREAAERAEAEARRAREQAGSAERLATRGDRAPATVSGADVTSPGVGSATDPAVAASATGSAAYRAPVDDAPGEEGPLDRPEVLAGLVFAGTFLLTRIFKRLVD